MTREQIAERLEGIVNLSAYVQIVPVIEGMIAEAVLAEREACAQLIEKYESGKRPMMVRAQYAAAAIRTRVAQAERGRR